MSMRFGMASAVGTVSTWALKHVLHRPAANFPGKVGLYADPQLLNDLRPRMREGAVVVAGTNGKTTVTNLLADALEAAGRTVACNRTGANLDSGVATALLQADEVDWGVLECDELWLGKVVAPLQPRYVVLVNLFRDQLDRMGEIDHIQSAVVDALDQSPATMLVYNGDDPLCQAVADRVPNRSIPFGLGESLNLTQNAVADAGTCQCCDSPLEYRWRQYGQLGAYRCPQCGFHRPEPVYSAHDITLGGAGVAVTVCGPSAELRVQSTLAGAYSAYNLLAACTAACCCGVPPEAAQVAVRSFAPHNGRLQRYVIGGADVLLNLAKNPAGLNQSLRIVEAEQGPKAVAFFINDREADGHDISWLWDADFQELASAGDVMAFAGGVRRNDVQVRLKYAGLDAQLVDGATDFVAKALDAADGAKLFAIANYTALPKVKAELDAIQNPPGSPANGAGQRPAQTGADGADGRVRFSVRPAGAPKTATDPDAPDLKIVHLYPELLNLYGDGGNVTILETRARKRGLRTETARVGQGERIDLSNADIVFLGGGPDREQRLASRELMEQADALRAYVEDGGVLLAICGGYQILGRTWVLGDEEVDGLAVLDIETRRAEGGSHNRLVGNIALESPLAHMPVIGYENHAGRTFLGPECHPFGTLAGRHGKGNNGDDGTDGAVYRNVVGTYLHGPLLAKNPEVADFLIERALARRAAKRGLAAPVLASLDDRPERDANAFMCHRLGVRTAR